MLEGDVLVGEGVQYHGADLAKVGGEVGGGVNADAQGQGVNEESDQGGGVGVGPARDQGADGEVARPVWRARNRHQMANKTTKSVPAAVRAAASQSSALAGTVAMAASPENSVRSGAG